MSQSYHSVPTFPGLLLTVILVGSIFAAGSARQITNHETNDYHAKWSPDGKYIAFTSQRSGEPEIWIVPGEGGDAMLIKTGLSGDHFFNWSADGKQMIFDAYGPDGPPSRLWLISVADGEVKPVLPDIVPAFHPALSPNGEWIVFACLRSGNPDIWKAKSNGDSLVRLTTSPGIDHHPQWSPDGRTIVFTSDREGNFDIWMIDADGKNEKQITRTPADEDHGIVSPDARLIVFTIKDENGSDIWLMPFEGGPAKRFTVDGSSGWACFSPDGKQIVWSSKRKGQSDLYIKGITGK